VLCCTSCLSGAYITDYYDYVRAGNVCNSLPESIVGLTLSVDPFKMKLFQTNSIVTVNCCREMFGIDLPSVTLSRRKEKFTQRLNHRDNTSVKRVISMYPSTSAASSDY